MILKNHFETAPWFVRLRYQGFTTLDGVVYNDNIFSREKQENDKFACFLASGYKGSRKYGIFSDSEL